MSEKLRRNRTRLKKKTSVAAGNPPQKSSYQQLVEHFASEWSRVIGGGAAYKFIGKQDGAHVKTILASVNHDTERAMRIIDCYLADDDPWITENGEGRGLGLLASNVRFRKHIAATADQSDGGVGEAGGGEPPIIADARIRGWGDDVDTHWEEWVKIVAAVEEGRVPHGVLAVRMSDFESGAEFRQEFKEGLKHAAG